MDQSKWWIATVLVGVICYHSNGLIQGPSVPTSAPIPKAPSTPIFCKCDHLDKFYSPAQILYQQGRCPEMVACMACHVSRQDRCPKMRDGSETRCFKDRDTLALICPTLVDVCTRPSASRSPAFLHPNTEHSMIDDLSEQLSVITALQRRYCFSVNR